MSSARIRDYEERGWGAFEILSVHNWNPKVTKPGFRGFGFIYSSYFLPSFLFFYLFFLFVFFLPHPLLPTPTSFLFLLDKWPGLPFSILEKQGIPLLTIASRKISYFSSRTGFQSPVFARAPRATTSPMHGGVT